MSPTQLPIGRPVAGNRLGSFPFRPSNTFIISRLAALVKGFVPPVKPKTGKIQHGKIRVKGGPRREEIEPGSRGRPCIGMRPVLKWDMYESQNP